MYRKEQEYKNQSENKNQSDKWRLHFHLMPPDGWLNDPNGLCWFRSEYHVFFQYAPGQPEGGLKHWGHYISKDLIDWEYAGIALSPEEDFESRGVYSGSALVRDGQMHLFYTGNVKLEGDYNYITDGRQGNTILVSSRDGRRFGKKELLMTNADYPDNLTCHVRDPKVVTGASLGIMDEKDYMLLGARTRQEEGEVLLYRSANLKDWELANILRPDEKFGYMWECPDAFMLDETKILSISPQGVERDGIEFANLYQSGYYLLDGAFDGEYKLNRFKEWDRGFDFYAPQTFEDGKGRRILIGWIGMPDVPEVKNPTVEFGWQNALTVPRQVFLKDGRVMQYPVEELKQLRGEEERLKPGEASRELACYDAEISLHSDENMEITVSDGLLLSYNKEQKQFSLKFKADLDLGCGRTERSVRLEHCRSIRMLMDTSCMELYLNGGEEVFTTRFYTGTGKSWFRMEKGEAEIRYFRLAEKLGERESAL
ncbi:MAG: glycoside hydrolase family 32 protein [Lachnospiraceae bacterium]|nr:glycoside hydrolase family 32 protein [Lachnospiraceae bacterium]